MRIASVLGQGLASAAGVGREPDSGALGPADGSLLVAVPPGSRGSCDAAEVEAARAQAGAAGEFRTFPPLPVGGRCLGVLCWG